MTTVSEQRFETYLVAHGFTEFDYEPAIAGTTKHPDYRVRLGKAEILFEVKEFEPPQENLSGGSLDLYTRIRSKIEEARDKFRGLKGHMCGLVLDNPHGALVSLEPMYIYGAMLGNVGTTMPFDTEAGVGDLEHATRTFLSGGKMHRYKNRQAIASQNTTISAICVLSVVNERARRLNIRVAQLQRETGPSSTLESLLETARETLGTEAGVSPRHRCIQVYENPYAAAPLVETFGTGPWDERFGVQNGYFRRVFGGLALMALEADERASGIERPDPLSLRGTKRAGTPNNT
jgi:hypothetical protein